MNKAYLWEKLGTDIQKALVDPEVYEIMLNPDGKLWVMHKARGNLCMGEMKTHFANAFVHALAQFENKFLNFKTPYLDTVLPFQGERINVTIPPIVAQVSFNIRKKATVVFTLDDYVRSNILTRQQAALLTQAVIDRKNILVSGSPAAGKTTFANALLDVIAKTAPDGHRVLLLEQVPELQCPVKNLKRFYVSEFASMRTLLWCSMRNSPDRIIVGEVRDGAALDLLKAWNTGCCGGVATIHANSARAAVQRILDLSCEVTVNPPYALAAEALDVIVQLETRATHPAKRVVTEIVEVLDFDRATHAFSFKTIAHKTGENA